MVPDVRALCFTAFHAHRRWAYVVLIGLITERAAQRYLDARLEIRLSPLYPLIALSPAGVEWVSLF